MFHQNESCILALPSFITRGQLSFWWNTLILIGHHSINKHFISINHGHWAAKWDSYYTLLLASDYVVHWYNILIRLHLCTRLAFFWSISMFYRHVQFLCRYLMNHLPMYCIRLFVCMSSWLQWEYDMYKSPTGQLRQSINICNMAFFRQKDLTTERSLVAF